MRCNPVITLSAVELVHHHAIATVLAAYCRCLDEMDLPALGACFTNDCEVIYGEGRLLRSSGRDALVGDLARMWRYARTSHHLSNVEIKLDGERAANVCSYVLAWHEKADGTRAVMMGRYVDLFVRTETSGWQISRRELLMQGQDGDFPFAMPLILRAAPPSGWVAPMPSDVGYVSERRLP
jgi:3-phenylpropionate/cinnamic acid dioxygenase small subunit